MIDKIEQVAKTPARVLITGENGTGKELVARAIHAQSHARDGAVRRGELRGDSERADRERAVRPHEGLVHRRGRRSRRASSSRRDGGTLFLDEIGDMSLAAQAKVLRVLQDGVVTRIGGAKPIAGRRARARGDEQERSRRRSPAGASARISSTGSTSCRSTCRRSASGARTFRCSSRTSSTLLTRPRGRRAARASTPDAVERLAQLDWPGNVRELRNTIERLLILVVGPAHHRRTTSTGSSATRDRRARRAWARCSTCKTFEEFKHAAERAFLLAKLREFDWNVSRDGARARHAAVQSVQEDRAVRPDREGTSRSG